MCKRKEYEAVLLAKDLVYEVTDKGRIQYPDQCVDGIKEVLRRNDCKYINKVAIITVLLSGCCRDAGGFMMPATRDCCANFKLVKNRLRKKLNLYVTAIDYDGEYYALPVWEV